MHHGTYFILITAAAIGVLLFLILFTRLHAFLALFIVSMGLGLAAGMPPAKVLTSMQAGVGDALGFIAVVVGLGAMIGRFLQFLLVLPVLLIVSATIADLLHLPGLSAYKFLGHPFTELLLTTLACFYFRSSRVR